QSVGCLVAAADRVRIRYGQDVESLGQGGRPFREPTAIRLRHPEKLADDQHRYLVGEAGHQVECSLAELAVEQLLDQISNLLAQPVHRAWRERLADQTSQAGVVGWILEQK